MLENTWNWIINKYSKLGAYYTGSQTPKGVYLWRRFRD